MSENPTVTEDDIESMVNHVAEAIGRTILNCIEKNKFNDGLRGFQMEFDDGTLIRIPFRVIKTDEKGAFDRCMMINASSIRKRDILEDVRHELVCHQGLEAFDGKSERVVRAGNYQGDIHDLPEIYNKRIIVPLDEIIELDFNKLISRIDTELERDMEEIKND